MYGGWCLQGITSAVGPPSCATGLSPPPPTPDCSCNIPAGDLDTIDDCYNSTKCPQPGATFTDGLVGELPSCSVYPSPIFKGGKGTIMSYCHQVTSDM